jgi:hypothetical protein
MFVYHSPSTAIGRVTIVAEEKDGKLKFAAARCTPDDNFSRKIGRRLASVRLHAGKTCEVLDFKSCNAYYFNLIAQNLALQVLLKKKDVK